MTQNHPDKESIPADASAAAGMHLASLTLRNFRAFSNAVVNLHPHLTVLIGENNGGKSAIIDAIRLVTQPNNGRRELYCEETDVRVGADKGSFEVEASYRGLGPGEKGLLISVVPDPLKDEAVIGLTYERPTPALKYGKSTHWGGKFRTAPEAGCQDLIHHAYLPPLRDAQRALASGNSSRVATLVRHFLGATEEKDFTKAMGRGGSHSVLEDITSGVAAPLNALTGGVRPQQASFGVSGRNESLADVARDLKFLLSDAHMDPMELRCSGLGYANILYMSIVLAELEKSKESDLTLLLVEEPEAHLHPQLQMAVLGLLRKHAQESATRAVAPGQPAGRIQVVVTTHSPNLTAWVNPEHVVIVRSRQELAPTRSPDESQADNATPLNPQHSLHATVSETVGIRDLCLKPAQLRKVSRYLDVTRAALLFGGTCILVEGIAEALLFPVFGRRKLLGSSTNAEDERAWLRLQSTTLVAIDGVDFEPYIRLLLGSANGIRVADRVVVVTDEDPDAPGNRAQALRALAVELEAPGALEVFIARPTFEQELYLVGNEAILQKAFLTLHPKSHSRWDKISELPMEQRAAGFLSLFQGPSPVRKGDYAQAVADILEDDSNLPFAVPKYLENAIVAASRSHSL